MAVVRTFVIKVEGNQAIIELNELNDAIKKVDTSMKSIKGSQVAMQKNSAAHATVLKGKAVPAMNEFSRVIQDLPYGMNGVANNLQQMTVQFGYLHSQVGGKGVKGVIGTLKVMLSSLAGPAGMVLAVSLVTAAMVKWGDKIFTTDSKQKALNETIKESNELYTTYAANLQKTLELQELVGIESSKTQSAIAKSRAERIQQLKDERQALYDEAADIKKRLERGVYVPFFGANEEEDEKRMEEIRKNIPKLTGEIRGLMVEGQKAIAEVVIEDNPLDPSGGTDPKEKIDPITGHSSRDLDTMFSQFKAHQDRMLNAMEKDAILDGLGEFSPVVIAEKDILRAEELAKQKKYDEEVIESQKVKTDFMIDTMKATGEAMVSLSLIAGKESAAGKALAVGAVLVSSAVAVINTWRQYTAMTAPGPWATAAAIAQTAVIGAATAAAIKQIVSSDSGQASSFPSGGGSGAPSYNVIAANPENSLADDIGASVIAGLKAEPVKAYVVGAEVTTQQALDRQVQAQASF